MSQNNVEDVQRLDERLRVVEKIIKKLEPDRLLKRIVTLETGDMGSIILTTEAACKYLNMKKSMLYKKTSAKEIPYYKPEGKKMYFVREELDRWMQRNPSPTVDDMVRQSQEYMANRRKGPNNNH